MRHIALILTLLFYQTNTIAQKPIDTAKSWVYWWWLESAVTQESISKNLQDYATAGFGGLHTIPIYGVKNNQQNNIQFLSQN